MDVSVRAEDAARTITNPSLQADVLARVAAARARAGDHRSAVNVAVRAEEVACTISDSDRQANALAHVAMAMAEIGKTSSAMRVAAAICAAGQWTIAVRPVLLLVPSAFTTLARTLFEQT